MANPNRPSTSLKRRSNGTKINDRSNSIDYQFKLLMIFAERGYQFSNNGGQFELGLRKLECAENYDRLVFRYNPKDKKTVQRNVYIQTIFSSLNSVSEFISHGNNDAIKLKNHFISFLETKEKHYTIIDSFVVATNVVHNEGEGDIKVKVSKKLFELERIIQTDESDYPKSIFGQNVFKFKESTTLIDLLINKCKRELKRTRNDILQKLLEANKIEEQVKRFLKSLCFCFNQPNIETINEEVVHIFGEEFSLLETNLVNDFNDAMWKYNLEEGKDFISNHDIQDFFVYALQKMKELKENHHTNLEEIKRMNKMKKIRAPLVGKDFQTILLMYFAQRSRMFNKKDTTFEFELGVDRDGLGKFDDIVFRAKESSGGFKNYFIQVKHSIKQITIAGLLSQNSGDPFQLLKYFSSFLKIKRKHSIDQCIIATNNGFDESNCVLINRGKNKNLKRKFCLQTINVNGMFLSQILQSKGNYYKLTGDDLPDELKNNFKNTLESVKYSKTDTDKEIKNSLAPLLMLNKDDEFKSEIVNFLDNLIFLVNLPDGEQIYDLMGQSISEEFYLLDSSILDKFYREMGEYRKTLRNDFLTGTEIDDFFKRVVHAIQDLTIYNSYYFKMEDLKINYKNNEALLKRFKDFLISKDESICQVKSSLISTLLTVTQVFGLVKKIRNNVSDLTEYISDNKMRFLKLSFMIKEMSDSGKIIKSFERNDGFNLLIIVCDTKRDPDELFSNLQKTCKLFYKTKKKVVFITSSRFNVTLEFACKHIDIISEPVFTNFTEESQSMFLDKTIDFQGNCVRIGDLFNSEEIMNDTLEEIIEKSLKIEKPVCLKDLEGTCVTYPVNITDKQLEDALKQNLNYPTRVLISGCDKFETRTNFLKLYDKDSRIHFEENDNDETGFRRLYKKFPSDVAYWIKYEKNGYHQLKKLYKHNIYIKRQLCTEKIMIEPNQEFKKYLLSPDLSDVVIFINISKQHLIHIFKITENEMKEFTNNLKENIKICEIPDNLKNKTTGIYLLKFIYCVDPPIFDLEYFSGTLDKIRDWSVKENTSLIEEDNFFNKVQNNKVMILINEPGMGKSMTLSSLAENRLKMNWVILINLGNSKDHIKDLPIRFSIKEVVTFLVKVKNLTAFGRDLATKTLESKDFQRPLLLLFDGFDELIDEYKSKLISLLKFLKDETEALFWVASRKHDQHILQNNLFVFCSELGKLENIDDQKAYLEANWKPQLALTLGREKLLQTFDSSINNKNSKFDQFCEALFYRLKSISSEKQDCFVVPLIMSLLAENLYSNFKKFIYSEDDDMSEYKDFNILSIYESFIHDKYKKYYTRKLLPNNDVITERLYQKWLYEKHFVLASTQCFPNKHQEINEEEFPDKEEFRDLLDVGLIQSRNPGCFEFVHRTFAEYFVAKGLTYQLKNDKKCQKTLEFVLENIFKSSNFVISQFLENILIAEDLKDKWDYIIGRDLLRNDEKLSRLQLQNNLCPELFKLIEKYEEGKKNDEKLSRLQLKNTSCHELVKLIENNMTETWSGNKFFYYGDDKLVDQLLFKFNEEESMLEIEVVIDFYTKYKDKCCYEIVNKKIADIYPLIIRKGNIKFNMKDKSKELENVVKNIHDVLFSNQLDSHLLETELEEIYEYCDSKCNTETRLNPELIYPVLINKFPHVKQQFQGIRNIKAIVNKLYTTKKALIKRFEDIRWFENMGINVAKTFMILTPEMAIVFNHVLDYAYGGWGVFYAKNIFNKLILCFINNTKNDYNIDKSALLDMFQYFADFCLQNKVNIYPPSRTEIVCILNCISCVVTKPEFKCYGTIFESIILSLKCLAKWNLKVIDLGDRLLIQDPDQDFQEYLHISNKEIVLQICKHLQK